MSDSHYLIHTTTQKALASIAKDGLGSVSYWAEDGEVSHYYVETIADEGEKPATLRLPLSVLEGFEPEPDHPGLEEPLTHTLGMKEEEVWEEWEDTNGSWQACLELIQSIRCRAPIPPHVLLAHNPELASLIAPSLPDVASSRIKVGR